MNPAFFQQIESALHAERIDAYRRDGADSAVALARYALNMALSEALYPSLQFAEIALRNAIHTALAARQGTEQWYDSIPHLLPWQKAKVQEAKKSLGDNCKPVTPGRMVAELNFGFWTGFFNKAHGQTGIGHHLAKTIFPHSPIPERNLHKLGFRWRDIRDLRNRVFHHERIIHWKDLDTRHQAVLEVIAWISPELHDLARTLDRFQSIRQQGLQPWIDKLRLHWPQENKPLATPDSEGEA